MTYQQELEAAARKYEEEWLCKPRGAFQAGAKWQRERENEVMNALMDRAKHYPSHDIYTVRVEDVARARELMGKE